MVSSFLRVLIPYFGPWPFWMPAFLASCRANSDISWHLFGDHPIGTPLPPNVTLEVVPFTDYCEAVSRRLGIRFQPAQPYKLCDLKPALGEVHRDLLDGCRFWAFSDLDLVYGDLLDHFGPLLDRWQIISTHATRISGHFALLRNNDRCIGAFREARDWRAQLENPQHLFFDESGFSHRLLPHKNWPRWLRLARYGHDPLVRLTRFAEEHTSPCAGARLAWIFGHEPLPQHWYWRGGRVTTDLTGARQFPYFHFLDWKRSWAKRQPEQVWQLNGHDLQTGWTMSEQGFTPLAEGAGA